LWDYDYSRTGAYFVTICAWQRESLFGEVVDGEMRLSETGRIVDDSWQRVVTHFSGVEIDQFVIMPNHFHGIVTTVGAGFPRPDAGDPRNQCRATPLTHQGGETPQRIQGGETPPLRRATLGQIVGYFKYQSTKRINQSRNNPGTPVWQRNYYERVIRDERELDGIRRYIAENPARWDEDENHPARQRTGA
jgi:REP element-mobilizing transposase RayT